MIVEKERGVGCNFCDRGQLSGNGYGLKFPYDFVYLIQRETNGLSARICEDCLKEMIKKTIKTEFTEGQMKDCAMSFFYFWWNAKGNNTEQGFRDWFPNYIKSNPINQ